MLLAGIYNKNQSDSHTHSVILHFIDWRTSDSFRRMIIISLRLSPFLMKRIEHIKHTTSYGLISVEFLLSSSI